MISEEEQEDDDVSTDGEQGDSVESQVSTRNLRRSASDRKGTVVYMVMVDHCVYKVQYLA